ncbi:sulfotransferase family domain-containing protein [Ditylenchus destructor]|uniref:Sulfotransferase family domain-containing protein n=1 Tax=Ditylenchus destructor TaxID=166010 RepID=A0AAD4N2I1_9BILA|nr:sulfotransferase family domain-containing protein [Ditylenchus destructor]
MPFRNLLLLAFLAVLGFGIVLLSMLQEEGPLSHYQLNFIKWSPEESAFDKNHETPSDNNSLSLSSEVAINDNHISKLVRFRLKQQRELERSQKRLNNHTSFQVKNNEELPTKSAFGTTTSDTICIGKDEENCIPKLKHFEARLRLAPKHNLLACLIQKNMSTILQAIFCYLFDQKSFLAAGRRLGNDHYNIRFCKKTNEMNAGVRPDRLIEVQNDKLAQHWKFISIVRDPIDRFLSGFVDKCVRKPIGDCNGCHANMTCFIIREYIRMKREAQKDGMQRSFEDRHFFPQNWRCNFNKFLSNYTLIRYGKDMESSLLDQISSILLEQNVTLKDVEFVRKEVGSFKTIHTTSDSDARNFFEKRLRNSPFLMEYVVRMFYHDFRIFNYTIPTFSFAT